MKKRTHKFFDDFGKYKTSPFLGDENFNQLPKGSQARLYANCAELGQGGEGQLAAVGVVLVVGTN
jgi:hypothetical protein